VSEVHFPLCRGSPHLEEEMSAMRPSRVQACQSQVLTKINKANFLVLWLFIRLASQFCTMLNMVVRFSCLVDGAPCLPGAADSFSSRRFNPPLWWISTCDSFKIRMLSFHIVTQKFFVILLSFLGLACISSRNVFVADPCSCFSAMSLHFKCVDVVPSLNSFLPDV